MNIILAYSSRISRTTDVLDVLDKLPSQIDKTPKRIDGDIPTRRVKGFLDALIEIKFTKH